MAKKRSFGDRVFRALAFILMSIFALSYLFILFWMVFGSFRLTSSFAERPFDFMDFNMDSLAKSYTTAFSYKAYGTTTMPVMILNSIIFVVGNLAVSLTIPCITGYILAKYNFKIKGILVNLTVITMVVPTVGSMSVTYRFMDSIGLLNTFPGVWIMAAGGLGFASLMYKNYFGAIPWSYAESAFLDGAGNFTVFMRIMLPQAKPLLISLGIMGFIGGWNDYMTPYMYLNDYPTVAFGLTAIQEKYKADMPYVFAAMTFATGVVLVVFCFFSDTIMNNMSAGGLKD